MCMHLDLDHDLSKRLNYNPTNHHHKATKRFWPMCNWYKMRSGFGSGATHCRRCWGFAKMAMCSWSSIHSHSLTLALFDAHCLGLQMISNTVGCWLRATQILERLQEVLVHYPSLSELYVLFFPFFPEKVRHKGGGAGCSTLLYESIRLGGAKLYPLPGKMTRRWKASKPVW